MRLLVGLALACSVALGCRTTAITVTKVTTQNSSKTQGYYYHLPQHRIIGQVVVRKTHQKWGPLWAYAEKYLGYNGLLKDEINYSIESITLKTVLEADPNEVYCIIPGKNANLTLSYSDNGTLLQTGSVMQRPNQHHTHQKNIQTHSNNQELEKQLSLLALKEKRDTIYKREILEDSVIVEKRLIERIVVQNTPDENAQEAMQKIIEIRQQKQQLLTFSEDIAYPASTIKIMLEELNNLEEQYLQLFLGHTSTEFLSYQFEYLPSKNEQGFWPLFKFNSIQGVIDSISPTDDPIYQTVYIIPQRENHSTLTEGYELRSQVLRKDSSSFVYLHPEKVKCQIVWNNQPISSATLWIAQLGATQTLPAHILGSHQLVFDPQTGMLRSIQPIHSSK